MAFRGRRHPRLRAALALLLLALVLAGAPAVAAQGAPAGTMDLYLPDALVIGPDETLRLEPGTRVHGPGHVEVRGRLFAEGTPSSPVVLQVPMAVYDGGFARLVDARVERVPGAAIAMRGGTVTLQHVGFADNLVGVILLHDARNVTLVGENATFERHAEAALRVGGEARVRLAGTAFLDNALGIHGTFDADGNGSALAVSMSRFERNEEHLVLDFKGATGTGSAHFEANAFTGGSRALVIRSDATPSDPVHAGERSVSFRDNLIRGATIGLVARGAGYAVDSRNDEFRENRVAVSAVDARITFVGTRFESTERDLDLGPDARVTFQGVRFTPSLASAEAKPSLLPVAVGAVLAGGAGLAAVRARRLLREARSAKRDPTTTTATKTASDPAFPPAHDESHPEPSRRVPLAPAEPPAPHVPPAAPPVSELEAKILREIAAAPGSAQTAIAQRLGLTRQALHYHVKKLVAAGLVEKTTVGRTTECRIAPGVRIQGLPLAVKRSDGVEKE